MQTLIFVYLVIAFVAFLLYFFTYPLERMAKDHFRPKVTYFKWGCLGICALALVLAVYEIMSTHPLGM